MANEEKEEVKAKSEASEETKAAPAKRESSSDSRRSSSDRDDRSGRDDRSRGGDDRGERKPFRRFYRRRQNQIVPAYVDWKDVEYLERFVPERGKIMPRRISGVTAKDQRRIARAIKRARVMALLPYVGD